MIHRASMLAALLCALLHVVAGLGRRLPAAAMVGAAALPWVLGVAGMADGLRIVERTTEAAEPSSVASLTGMGVAEASCARTLGATLGGALLAAVAVGIGIVAIGQRAPERRSCSGS